MSTPRSRRPERLSVEHRAALLDDTVDMVVVLDVEGRLVHANQPAVSVLGWSPDQAPVPVIEFMHPDDHEAMLLALRRFVEGTTRMRPRRLRIRHHVSGEWIWVEVLSRNRIGVPGIDGVVIAARDISEQVDSERRIAESEQRFRSIVTSSADSVLLVEPAGSILYASPQAEEILGLGAGALTARMAELIHPDDVTAALAVFRQVALGEVGGHERHSCRVRRRDGEWRWIDSSVVNQMGVPGVDSLVVHARDVTDTRAIEETLRHRVDADELVNRISSRFVEVGADEIHDAVSESLQQLGEFAHAGRAWIFQLDDDGQHIDHTHEWCAPGVTSEIHKLKGLALADLPGFAGWLGDTRPLLVRSVSRLDEAERVLLEEQGIKSLASVAMFVRGELHGIIGLDAVATEVRWPDHVVWALEACANIFGSALQRCEAETALVRNEARFRAMFSYAADGVRLVDSDMHTVYASPAVTRITGYGDADLADPGDRLLRIHPDDRETVEDLRDRLQRDPGGTVTGTYRVLHPEGHWVHVEEVTTNLVHDPSVRGYIVNIRDVTERQSYEAELLAQARRDPLTALPNRLLFEELLDAALARRDLTGADLAVIALGLDRFKLVNESLGHRSGDQLLTEAAERLRSAARRGDTVARLSGDEFVVLCEPIESSAELEHLTASILEAFRVPFDLAGQNAHCTVSLGAAQTTSSSGGRSELMRDAESALSVAKKQGRNRSVVFTPDLADTARERIDTESGLRRALDDGELRLVYQPIVDLDTEQVVGAEALLRWQHPDRGLLGPAAFLTVAEESGLIAPIGAWVIGEACRQLAAWSGSVTPEFALHLNVSVRQLDEGGVADAMRGALVASGLDARSLCVEITESALLAGQAALDELDEVRSCGVHLGLDDFGTGHSPLTYLRDLSIDLVKIDRQFVDGVADQGSDTAIVTAILHLADSLGLSAIAEGVETPAQASALRELGCTRAQGYWFARPLAPTDFLRFIDLAGR
ncbi:MAG: sensor domain-containing protein [Acidimicrobiales bacterium]